MAFRRLSAGFLLACVSVLPACEDAPDEYCSPTAICDLGPFDGGPRDSLPDADMDPAGWPGEGGAPRATCGESCTPERGCRTAAAFCLHPSTFGETTLGGSDDPIVGHPDGESTEVPTPLFPGGYCTTSWPEDGVTPSQCNLRGTDDRDPVCGDCMRCIDILGLDTAENTAGFVPGFCAANCAPSLSDNECREGYECLLTQEVCLLGCQSDDECRIAREETNGVEGIQNPADCVADASACTPSDCGDASPADPEACASPATNFDSLVYDTDSSAVCDPTTFRCTGAPSTASAAGGDPCTYDSECEAEGFCITEGDDGSWAGGSCTKWRCDLEGNACANDGICQEAGVGIFGCFEGCTVGGVDPSSETGTWIADGSAQSTCREGYGCYWGGESAAGVADNGVCLPTTYSSAVTTPNTGATCESDADCFSPFGQGFCIDADGFDSGYCSIRNCAAPWFTGDANVCGAGAECVAFDLMDATFALCVQTCESADECSDGLGCVDFTEDTKACWPGCGTSADCRAGETCENPSAADSACVPE